MGSREFVYDPEQICDGCGEKGAFDIYGDCLCSDCLEPPKETDEDRNCKMMDELWGGLECDN